MPERARVPRAWSERSLKFRLDLLKRFKDALLAERDSCLDLLAELRPSCSRSELITSELIPLFDNIRFLLESSASILAPQALGRKGQPLWLFGVDSVIHREAVGCVLIVAPANYPLFLPLVQALYAWAAGNSVWLKSAPGSLPLHDRVRDIFLSVGGTAGVFQLLGESNEAYSEALAAGVDKVVLVGSAATGAEVLSQAGRALVPAVAELSGWDAVYVHPDADLALAASAVAFGLALNGGRTCVAPRRIFFRGDVERFESLLEAELGTRASCALSVEDRELVEESERGGARALGRGPVVLSRVGPDHRLLREVAFGALAVLVVTESDEESLELSSLCGYALGASLFGPLEWARDFAHEVAGQVIVINDMIVPSADPRLPFGGSGRSGFGRTRGREGLLEMTATRVVSVRRGGTVDHLRPPAPSDDAIVERFLLLSHRPGVWAKAKALAEIVFLIGRERVRRRRLRDRIREEGLN